MLLLPICSHQSNEHSSERTMAFPVLLQKCAYKRERERKKGRRENETTKSEPDGSDSINETNGSARWIRVRSETDETDETGAKKTTVKRKRRRIETDETEKNVSERETHCRSKN